MKVKRYKRVQKYLQFYKNKFGFRSPFQILIDGTFCQFSLQNKVNISEQMPKYLSDSCKLFTTVCVVEETQRLSQSLYGAMIVIKQFPIRKCGHEKSPIAANECLREVICGNNNADHYMLATQDSYLTRTVRQSTVCPLIYLKRNTIVMEKPLDSVRETVRKEEEKSYVELGEHEIKVLNQLKRKYDLEEEDQKGGNKRRKGPKGPNPLSCKKKKKKSSEKVDNSCSVGPNRETTRKRKRNRVPKHIIKMFDKIESNLS